MPGITWSALDLSNVRTDFLRSIDLARIPASARIVIVQELVARRREG